MPADHHGCCNPPELELPAPPPRPAQAHVGPDRAQPPCATSGSRVQQPPLCALHMATTRPPCTAARRPTALDHRRCPIQRDAEDERDPASIVDGASFARPRPPTEAEGRDGRGAARRAAVSRVWLPVPPERGRHGRGRPQDGNFTHGYGYPRVLYPHG
jgi:hypothetical protein